MRGTWRVGLLVLKEYLGVRGGSDILGLDKDQVLERASSPETTTLNYSSGIVLPQFALFLYL